MLPKSKVKSGRELEKQLKRFQEVKLIIFSVANHKNISASFLMNSFRSMVDIHDYMKILLFFQIIKISLFLFYSIHFVLFRWISTTTLSWAPVRPFMTFSGSNSCIFVNSQHISRPHHHLHSCLRSALATLSRCLAMKNMLGSLAQRSTIFPFVILPFRRYLQSPIVQPQTVFIS